VKRAAAALLFLALSCRSADRPPESSLPQVVLPDLSPLAAPVRQQLTERFAALTRANASASARERAESHGALGGVLLAAGFSHQAELCYRHAEAIATDDPRWPYMLGHVYLAKGDRAAAAASFERALAASPADAPAQVWLAQTRLDDGRVEEAESLFLQALARQPSAAAAFGAGRAALARQAYRDATARFEQALTIDPGASAVHYPLAMAYRALGDRSRAELHFRLRGDQWPALADPVREQQTALAPTIAAYERRGVDAMGVRDWGSAIDAFRQGLALAPDDAALRHRLGTALAAAGDPSGAARELEEVVRRHPGYVNAHVSLGFVHAAAGRYREAIARFTTALQADRNHPEARLGLAAALRASGRLELALGHYAHAVKIDPALVDGWLGGAAVLVALGRSPEAHDWIARARRVHPDEPRLRDLEGRSQ
jgi:tetratricopeptide (TPR) repeat protein